MNETSKRAVTGEPDSRSGSFEMPALTKPGAVTCEAAATAAILVLRHAAANSWYRTQLSSFPKSCPVCGREVAEVWQDHHLARPYEAGWLFGSWMCQSNIDGQDCSRFVFVHEDEAEASSVIFNCQRTRALRVEEICRQVLAAKKQEVKA